MSLRDLVEQALRLPLYGDMENGRFVSQTDKQTDSETDKLEIDTNLRKSSSGDFFKASMDNYGSAVFKMTLVYKMNLLYLF